jgi:hypothetical protein
MVVPAALHLATEAARAGFAELSEREPGRPLTRSCPRLRDTASGSGPEPERTAWRRRTFVSPTRPVRGTRADVEGHQVRTPCAPSPRSPPHRWVADGGVVVREDTATGQPTGPTPARDGSSALVRTEPSGSTGGRCPACATGSRPGAPGRRHAPSRASSAWSSRQSPPRSRQSRSGRCPSPAVTQRPDHGNFHAEHPGRLGRLTPPRTRTSSGRWVCPAFRSIRVGCPGAGEWPHV